MVFHIDYIDLCHKIMGDKGKIKEWEEFHTLPTQYT